jgi:hypothetical protein
MNIILIMLLCYLFVGVYGSLILLKKGPKTLMGGSIIFFLYVSVPAIAMAESEYSDFAMLGQVLTIFFSIVSGALYSSAWNELRKNAREDA